MHKISTLDLIVTTFSPQHRNAESTVTEPIPVVTVNTNKNAIGKREWTTLKKLTHQKERASIQSSRVDSLNSNNRCGALQGVGL